MSYGPSISLENAKKVAAAALAEVRKNNWTMAAMYAARIWARRRTKASRNEGGRR